MSDQLSVRDSLLAGVSSLLVGLLGVILWLIYTQTQTNTTLITEIKTSQTHITSMHEKQWSEHIALATKLFDSNAASIAAHSREIFAIQGRLSQAERECQAREKRIIRRVNSLNQKLKGAS